MVSTTSQYALRALLALARLPKGEPALGRQLAAREGIPHNYLAKILKELNSAGIVSATRGIGGGYRLERDPARLRLVDIVDLFDKARIRDECLLDGLHLCSDTTPCAAHHAWRHVKFTYQSFLERTTLATLVGDEPASPLVSALERRP